MERDINQLAKPDDELDLPDTFNLDDFWKILKKNEEVQSGKWVKGYEGHLTFQGLLSLKDGAWLNADFMDHYLEFTTTKREGEGIDRVRYIPTYAMLSYNNTKNIPEEWYWPLRSADIVLVPVHLYDNHWTMAVVDIPKRRIKMMDSLNKGRNGRTKSKLMDTIWEILHKVADQQGAEKYFGKLEDWNCNEVLDIPQQNNGTDCGIFALLFARFAAERRPINFDQRHIPYFRRRFCYDIMHTINQGRENNGNSSTMDLRSESE